MGFKNIIKKYGKYALGVLALTGGMVATNVLDGNSVKVSASEVDKTYLVREFSAFRDGHSNENSIDIFNLSDSVGITKAEDVNAIVINSQSVRYTGGTFSYYRDKNFFKIDVSNMDDFNFERDVVIGENSHSGSYVESTSYASFTFYFYNSNGGIESFLEREDLYQKMNEIYDLCARAVIVPTDENVQLTHSKSTIMSISLCKVGIDENNKMTTNLGHLGNVGFSMLSSNTSYQDVDVNFYVRSLNDLLFATIDGTGLYTKKDVDNAHKEGYDSGLTDGLGVANATNHDKDGKYSYIFDVVEHGNKSSQIVTLDESNKNTNILSTIIHVFVNGVEFNFYSDVKYLVNVDGINSVEDLTYDRITRYGGDDTIVNTSEYYLDYMMFDFYSPSNDLVGFINSMNFSDLREKMINLIIENELSQINENYSEISLHPHLFQLRAFGTMQTEDFENEDIVIEMDYENPININSHDGGETQLSVIKRSYNDLMYGTMLEEGYTEGQFLEYGELKYNQGYEDALIEKDDDIVGIPENSDYFRGWESGYQEGIKSVDITQDNQQAIEDYIIQNNMKSEDEFLEYGEIRFNEGKEESANEYADRLSELDVTINNLNREINELNSKINDYENTDDKYQLGFEQGQAYGESIGYDKGFEDALSTDIESYGKEQYQIGFNNGYSSGYSTAQNEKDEEIGNIEQEKDSLVEQVERLQNDISGLNGQINTLTGTINSLNSLIDTKYSEGFEDGKESVDVTVDNNIAINEYLLNNNLKSEEDYLKYGNEQYNLGVSSVDVTSNDEDAIVDYLEENELKTKEEYLKYGETNYKNGYSDNSFKNQIKRVGNSVGTFFVNIGKGIVQYVAFGWAWDKSGRFIPKF